MTTPRRIYLTGLLGSGKSAVAPLIAARLGWSWVDLDGEIERRENTTIAALFAASEASFRAVETTTLVAAAQREPLVIATGGGVVVSPANRALMCDTGVVVTLDVSPAIAARRVTAQGIDRPLLRGDALARLHELHAARAPLYAEAAFGVMTDDCSPEQVAMLVIAGLVTRGLLTAPTAEPVQIPVALPRDGYTINVGWGALGSLSGQIDALGLSHRLTIVTDTQVARLYLPGVAAQLQQAGYDVGTITIPAGESSKDVTQLHVIYDALIARRAERDDAIVALGGGVVGDLAGFAAATYLRGVPLLQVPTTLLAQVDSAIGGKTGINHPLAKNAIGAFYQPRAVVIDPAVLLTLDDRLFSEGWGEIVKYGVALDGSLFADLEAQHASLLARDAAGLTAVIARCAAIKAAIIAEDEREAGRRILLNYGHTIGHALEALTGFRSLLHGEAVFLGMAIEARVAVQMGLLDAAVVARQDALARSFGAPTVFPTDLTPEAILAATRLDKKSRGGQVRWVLPTAIGMATVTTVADAVAQSVLASVQSYGLDNS